MNKGGDHIKGQKKITAVILTILFLFLLQSVAFAANTAEVFADEITAEKGKAFLIPVKITNNTGIMGFKITVTYDKSVFTSPTVSSGSITKAGMLNNSIGVSADGTFDVVWSGTENAVGDGTLMILGFKAADTADKETKIGLSFSQPDTFNEAWEDVELKCSEITVNIVSEKTKAETSEASQAETAQNPGSEDIKNAVEIVLDETEKGGIKDVGESEQQDFVGRVNEILGQLSGNGGYFNDMEDVENAYSDAVEDEFVEKTLEATDSDKIDFAIDEALSSAGVEKLEDVPEEKKAEFVQSVEKKLSEYAPDIETVSDKLTDEEAFEAIKQLRDKNESAATQGKKVPAPQAKNKTVTVIAVAAAAVAAVITAVAVIYIKHKQKNEEAKKYEDKN